MVAPVASFSFKDVDSLIISVIAPRDTDFVDMGRIYLNLDPMVVGVGIKTGMPIMVENPRGWCGSNREWRRGLQAMRDSVDRCRSWDCDYIRRCGRAGSVPRARLLPASV